MHDALTATDLLEHALRPLPRAPPPDSGSPTPSATASPPCRAWPPSTSTHGPLLLTEHGVYLRERYLGYRTAPYALAGEGAHARLLPRLLRRGYRRPT